MPAYATESEGDEGQFDSQSATSEARFASLATPQRLQRGLHMITTRIPEGSVGNNKTVTYPYFAGLWSAIL